MVGWSCYFVDYDFDSFYWLRVAVGTNESLGKDSNYKLGKCFASCWNEYCWLVVGRLCRR